MFLCSYSSSSVSCFIVFSLATFFLFYKFGEAKKRVCVWMRDGVWENERESVCVCVLKMMTDNYPNGD